jgi:hypothetical protein
MKRNSRNKSSIKKLEDEDIEISIARLQLHS